MSAAIAENSPRDEHPVLRQNGRRKGEEEQEEEASPGNGITRCRKEKEKGKGRKVAAKGEEMRRHPPLTQEGEEERERESAEVLTERESEEKRK